MNKILITIICSLTFVYTSIANELSSKEPQKGYTTSILREPVFDYTKVIVEAMMINEWLNLNYKKLTYEQMKGPREHLYYLIDSYVKYLYAKEKIIIPKQHDLTLASLFSWAEKLGVYGGAKIYNAIKSSEAPELPMLMKLPDQISLNLEGDRLTINAKEEEWSFKIPYYFMTWRVDNFKTTNGIPTQLVVLSTGASVDKSDAGRSQATIMFMYSPGEDLEKFSNYWKKALNINDKSKEIILNSYDRISLHTYDDTSKIHKEITIWHENQGAFAVAYLGMDGTYQWNRPHFLDFLRSIKIK